MQNPILKSIFLIALLFLLTDGADAAILTTHPRIWQESNLVSELRSKACRDNSGTLIGGCTPSPQWTTYYNYVNPYRTGGSYYGMEAWHHALIYQITRETDFANRAKGLVMAEIADGINDERFDQYLYVHLYLMNASIVYDFLYDRLTAAERATIRDYINQLLYELWNHDDNPYNEWPGWSVNDPGNNYFYHHIDGTAYAALALHDENPAPPPLKVSGTSYSTILDFLYAKLDQQSLAGYLDNPEGGKGGGWHEGNGYGLVSKMYLMEAFWTLKKSGARDYFSRTGFPREAALYHLYSIQPGNSRIYPGGDLPNDVEGAVRSYDRWLFLFLARGLEGSDESRYAQYWTRNVLTEMGSYRWLYPWDFILSNGSLPAANPGILPLSYHAVGLDWMNSRSSWQDDAVSVSFICTDRKQSHQHADQNSFVIYRTGWQAMDANEASSGLLAASIGHNTFLINNEGQRYADNMASMVRYGASSDYTYASGDAGNAYYSGAGAYGEGTTPLLNSWIRELVHVQPNYLVVYDKVSPVNAGYSTRYLLHFPTQPTISQNLVTAVNGQGRLFQKTLLPSGYNLRTVRNTDISATTNGWRIELTPQAQQYDNYFLNVIEVDGASVSAMANTVLVSADNGAMRGASVQDLTENRIVLFAANPDSKPLTGTVSYQVNTNRKSRHILVGIRENYAYNVASSGGSDFQAITTDQGVLSFGITSAGNSTYTISEVGPVPNVPPPVAPTGLSVQ